MLQKSAEIDVLELLKFQNVSNAHPIGVKLTK